MPYEHLLLDLDNTLLDTNQLTHRCLTALFARFSLPYTPAVRETFYRLNAHYWGLFEAGKIEKDQVRLLRFKDLIDLHGLSGVTPEELAVEYLRLAPGIAPVFDGVHEVLAALRETATLSMITNGFSETQRGKIETGGLGGYFAHIFIGEEVDCLKPAPRFFQTVYDAIGRPDKSGVLVVGDSLGADIGGGAAFGLPTCWVNVDGAENTSGVTPDYEITHVRELLPIQDR